LGFRRDAPRQRADYSHYGARKPSLYKYARKRLATRTRSLLRSAHRRSGPGILTQCHPRSRCLKSAMRKLSRKGVLVFQRALPPQSNSLGGLPQGLLHPMREARTEKARVRRSRGALYFPFARRPGAIAPDRLIASRVNNNRVNMTRPICSYPAVAHYNGVGSTNDAANFACKVP